MSWWDRMLRAMVRRIVRAELAPIVKRVETHERRLDKLEGPHPYRVPTSIVWHVSQPTEE